MPEEQVVSCRPVEFTSSEWEGLPSGSLTKHQVRQVLSQVKGCALLQSDRSCKKPRLVVEVFSPPRFAVVAEEHGFNAHSVDLTLGVDLTVPANRAKLKQDLKDNPPDLLVLCPPCTDEGGWFNLNAIKLDRLIYF